MEVQVAVNSLACKENAHLFLVSKVAQVWAKALVPMAPVSLALVALVGSLAVPPQEVALEVVCKVRPAAQVSL